MQPESARYVVDEDGKQTAVIIDIEEYRALLVELRQYQADEDEWLAKVYTDAKAEPDADAAPEPLESVVAEIERELGWTTK